MDPSRQGVPIECRSPRQRGPYSTPINSVGKRVTLSGKGDGLYRHAPIELAGVSRDDVVAGLRALIEAGCVVREEGGGLHPADDGEAPPLAAE